MSVSISLSLTKISMTLRVRLLLLVLAVLIPTAGLFVWIVAATYLRETESAQQRLRETTRALALVVDRELDQRAAIARTLASSSAIAQGDLQRFYNEAKAASLDTGNWVVLVDNDHQLLNTSVPYGTPLPKRAWTPGRSLATSAPQVSNLRIGPVSKKPVLAVFAPDKAFNPTRYNVGVVFTPTVLQTQILLNLLNNAAKYTPEGGRIDVTVARSGDEAVVSIRDSGIGIAAEHLPGIFQMFSQVAPAIERSHGGLGIGLALARGLLELHGGSVEAHSAGLGEGSEFVVRLPLAQSSADASDQPADAVERAAASACRVLIVDDNRDAADSLALMLALSGHEVHTANDGAAALSVAAAVTPDVVLLDIGMPILNGYEVAQRIRREPWGQRMILVALTGWVKKRTDVARWRPASTIT